MRVFYFWILFALISCGDDSSPSASPPAVQKFFTHGNPMQLVKNAQADSVSPYTAENIQELSHFALDTITIFTERSREIPRPSTENVQDTLEEGQKPDTGEKLPDIYPVTVLKEDDNKWTLLINMVSRGEQASAKVALVFSPVSPGDSKLTVTHFSLYTGDKPDPKETFPVQPIHFSTKEGGKAQSILIKGEDEDNNAFIAAFYFNKHKGEELVEAPLLKEKRPYLMGIGRASRWFADNINIEICIPQDENTGSYQNLITEAFKKWDTDANTEGINIGSRTLNITLNTEYPPFSDLNHHCIYSIPSFLAEAADWLAVGGVTVTDFHTVSGEILDSDIFIFEDAIKKIAYSTYQKVTNLELVAEYYKVMIHEQGHQLGLGHVFDDANKKNSVMSYEYVVTEPTLYDLQSVQYLYPQ